ncbi:MAG TPA: hypothetical protein P5110_06965 [Candidatus Omnitrophota bacterium]|nr:hypothetical protein [Candidatus Omnitrophota bacterium]
MNEFLIKIDPEMEIVITETVIQDFGDAESDRANKEYYLDSTTAITFEDKQKALKECFYGKRQPKSVPWQNCSNRSMKITMAIIEMLHSRMFPMVYNEELTRWRPAKPTSKYAVDRVTKLMYWWVRVRTHMRVFFDKWTKMALGYGDVLTETQWDVDIQDTGEVTETPVTDEFGIPLTNKDGSPAVLQDPVYETDEKTRVDIIPRENIYFPKDAKDIYKDPVCIKCEYTYAELEQMEREGKVCNVTKPISENSRYLFKEYKDRIDQISVNASGENAEIIKEVRLRALPITIVKEYRRIDFDRDGYAEDCRILVDPLTRTYLGAVMVRDISQRNRRPLDFTKVNDMIDDPDGMEGYGYIEMVKPLADEIDAIFNQLTDGNTLSVIRPFFYDPMGNIQPQTITLAPNKGVPVHDPQKNVYFPDINVPTEKLLLALRTVLEFVERLTAASSYVMGKESEIVGGSGTATRTQAIMSSSDQRHAMPAHRLREGAARVLTSVLDILLKNLPPGLEDRIVGDDGQPMFGQNELVKSGLASEVDAYLLEDAAMGSMQAEQELAQMLYSILMQNPIVATDPVKIYNETAFLLRAYKQDPVEHLGPAPDPKDVDTPEDENKLIISGQFQSVRAMFTENHLWHIQIHGQLLQSPSLGMITPEQQQLVIEYVQQHIQEHMQLMQQMMSMMQQVKGGKGGQPAGNVGATPGAPQQPGMAGRIPGPFGQVEKTKEAGAGANTPEPQPAGAAK